MTPDPEDTLAQQEVEGRRKSRAAELRRRVEAILEQFGHATPAEDHAAYLASDSGPYGFGDIELPEEREE